MTAPRYRATTWSGLENFECALCPFRTLARGTMVNHVRRNHPTAAEGGGVGDGLELVPFASAAAENMARAADLTARHFHGQEPTGAAGGFTTSDVRPIVANEE